MHSLSAWKPQSIIPGESPPARKLPQNGRNVRVGDYTTGSREWLPIQIRENPKFENRNLRSLGGPLNSPKAARRDR
jgi:hypothetical protein